eukprot:Em0001g1755a
MESRGDVFKDFIVPLLAGGLAGTAVDVTLFPLDTMKTRLQSSKGFWASGGFRRIYAGILPAASASAPSAALFFCTYELLKVVLGSSHVPSPWVHMLAATAGEVSACVVRVPCEVIKQRTQTSRGLRPSQVFKAAIESEVSEVGLVRGFRGLYRGYLTTLSREIPFSFIQFPLWEYLKVTWRDSQGGRPLEPWQGAVCGALAGAVAAAMTTPLDVAKTRVMLAKTGDMEVKASVAGLLVKIGREEGLRGLFSGFVPRICWIGLGGFVFLGAYEQGRHLLLTHHHHPTH